MSRLVSYCRVSSDSQKDNTSIAFQRTKIEAHCLAGDHSLVAHFEDTETATGKRLRPGFLDALTMVYSNHADGLIVLKLDRYARSTMEGLQIAAELKKRGKELVVVDLHLDSTTPTGACMFTILLAFAQLERDVIFERTEAGRKATAAAGLYAYGRPPFGWDAGDGRLVLNAEEQKVRQLIIEWRLAGMTCTAIAEELNRREISAKGGGRWWKSSVYKLLSRDKFRLAHIMEGLGAPDNSRR
jgi:site-specific DNA recombinase